MNLNMENLNSKTNKVDLEEMLGASVKEVVSGVKDFKSLRGPLLQSFKDMETAIKLNQNPIKIGNKQLKTAEDIFNGLKDGSIVGKELGRVEKGFLKSSSTSSELRRSIIVDYINDKNVLNDMSRYANTRELRKGMSSKGYPKETIDEVIKQMKSGNKPLIDKSGNLVISGGGKTKPTTKTVTTPNPKISPQQTKIIQDRITELRDLIKNKKAKWSKVVKWGAGLGISAIALWWFFNDNSDEIAPDDIPVKQPVDPSSLKPCVKALVDSGAGEIFYGSDGSIRVWVRKTGNEEYDKMKGLVFFQNGRVISQDRTKKGSYTCKGRETVLAEQALSSGEYDIIQAIDTATKGMGTDVKKLKNALSKIKDARTYNNINRQMSDYTSYGSIQSMLQGEMGVANYEDMQQIRRYLANAGVDVKFRSQTLLGGTIGVQGSTIKLSTLSGGEGGQKKPSTTTGDLSGIEITWDGDKVNPSPNPDVTPSPSPSPKPSIYKECKDFPYVFGCISERIAEIQRCLGIQSDGKFGPGTLKAIEKVIMDNSKDAVGVSGRGVVIVNELRRTGITKEMYQGILKHCKVENKPVIKTGNTQTTTTGTTKTDTTKTITTEPDVKSTETTKGETPADLYARLVKGGYLRGRLRGKRIVYKGPDLSKEDQEKLTKYFESQGYRLSRDNFDKKYGDKYVFKKNNPEEETK
jgi:hypothetical protein